jgi:DNA-binding IscR family transcriptional regulator
VYEMHLKKYEWENYASVDMLSQLFRVSKRRVQQVISELRDFGHIEMVVGVYGTYNPYAIPLYRRVDE